jgi:hypothetical protein
MALTLHLHRPERPGGARSAAVAERRARLRAWVDLDAVYRDDDFLDEHD